MNLIDTHAHLTFDQLAGDIDELILRSTTAGVTSWITIGTDCQENQKAIDLASKFENMYAAVGIHPHEASKVTDEDLAQLKESARNPKVVAIGETGLDFHYDFSAPDVQKQIFLKQLEIANELDLPVVIHSREAIGETLEILDSLTTRLGPIVFHCFTGTAGEAQNIIDKGYYISFTGAVTFKNAENVRQAARVVPVERMMLETDCPYMSPVPVRNIRPNEPALLVHTARLLAGLKQMNEDIFAEAVTLTSRKFFRLS